MRQDKRMRESNISASGIPAFLQNFERFYKVCEPFNVVPVYQFCERFLFVIVKQRYLLLTLGVLEIQRTIFQIHHLYQRIVILSKLR